MKLFFQRHNGTGLCSVRRRPLRWMPNTFPSYLVLVLFALGRTVPLLDINSILTSAETLSVVSSSSSSLWEPPEKDYRVIGPTTFPKPTRLISKVAEPILKPTFGVHRPDKDAIFAYAEGYELAHYRIFMESLQSTGFDGDVVFAIAALAGCEPGVEDYLRAQANVVVYAADFLHCSADNFQSTTSRKQDGGGAMSFQMCKLQGIYGDRNNATDGKLTPVDDPRAGRVVATSRYELYWIWCLNYRPTTWLMLLDARDAYFQSNPFVNLPRQSQSSYSGQKITDGLLYFFGENTKATRLGLSVKNRKWLERGYSVGLSLIMKDKPTICSGSTMGEQIAMEAYLRAIINEWDETGILMKGADQGFHNYLYYSGKLQNVHAIRKIEIFEQGAGRINNIGALRIRPLSTWQYDPDPTDPQRRPQIVYNNHTHEIFNRDGSPSPVVHQWDRDAELFTHTSDRRMRRYRREFREQHDKGLQKRRRKHRQAGTG